MRRKNIRPLFEGKKVVQREELLKVLREDRGVVPGFPGRRLRLSDRVELKRKLFPVKKFGSKN